MIDNLDTIYDENALSIDNIIGSKELAIRDKLIKILVPFSFNYPPTSHTITLALFFKEESADYLQLFIELNKAGSFKIFGYEHLYHLVLQSWMESPINKISNDFKKNLITCGFNETLPINIIEKIKNDASSWFINSFIEKTRFDTNVWIINSKKNSETNDLINWLVEFDKTGILKAHKQDSENEFNQSILEKKSFQKTHNMTKEEYEIVQWNAKMNGLCKYIRENKTCPKSTSCYFYHGSLEETYGIQRCKYNEKCESFKYGECKFLHQPTNQKIIEIKKFYKLLRYEKSKFYTMRSNMESYIDNQCMINPYVILKKHYEADGSFYYDIPKCNHTNSKTSEACRKNVFFMTKNNGEVGNFYCCYEHMRTNERNEIKYVVKQNFLQSILE